MLTAEGQHFTFPLNNPSLIEVIVEKEITATSLIKKKIVKYILKQGNVKTEPVKEDTGEFANTTIHKKDASEKTTVNTSMSTKEEKKFQ